MLTLALETSTGMGSVALGEAGELLGESLFPVGARHSRTILPEARRLLSRSGREVGDLGRVIAGSGPGSFTGVRVAAALAKGLVRSTGAELLVFSGLDAIAEGTGLEERVCALLPARGETVYAAAWERRSDRGPQIGPAALPLGKLLDRLETREPEEGWTFAGRGAREHSGRIGERGGRVLSPLHDVPRASALLRLAERRPAEGRPTDPGSWGPTYLRASGAERGV